MRTTVLLLAFLLIAAPVNAIEFSGNTITLSDEDIAHCIAEGGCQFVTKAAALQQIDEAAKRRAGNCMGSASFWERT